jgi:hypothetical protein
VQQLLDQNQDSDQKIMNAQSQFSEALSSAGIDLEATDRADIFFKSRSHSLRARRAPDLIVTPSLVTLDPLDLQGKRVQ